MSAHGLLNFLNELWKRNKMRGLPSILSLLRNEFNNTGARLSQDIKKYLKSHFGVKRSRFCHLLCNVIMDAIT